MCGHTGEPYRDNWDRRLQRSIGGEQFPILFDLWPGGRCHHCWGVVISSVPSNGVGVRQPFYNGVQPISVAWRSIGS